MKSIVAAALAAAVAAQTPVVINTTYGLVQGSSDGSITTFHKIPFAAPPVGQLRFAAPQPPAAWPGVYDATPLPEPCPQLKIDGTVFLGSEDCLYLQIYVPEGVPGPMPVLFWIYGGGYVLGDSSEFGWYEGTNLAKKTGAIIVTHNYRLGPLGFMALSSLQDEDPNKSTGNAALQDQTLAMKWVHDNIASFGGDPTRVTIFGESAGGFSVCWHMVSEASVGLFSSAIMESGSCDSPQFFQTLPNAIEFNTIYAQAVGCNVTDGPELVSCLRALSTNDIQKSLLDMLNPNWPFTSVTNNQTLRDGPYNLTSWFIHEAGLPTTLAPSGLPALAPFMPWGPAIDGASTGLKGLPLNLITAGTFNKVPIILGTNANEGSIFVPAFPIIVPGVSFPPSDADIPKVIEHALDMYPAALVANVTNAAMAYYPPTGDNWARGADILRDLFFTCGTRRSARALSQWVPTYLYQFSHKLSFEGGLEYDLLGDYHTSELYFVWRNQWPAVVHTFDANDWTIADAINAFWGNMAATGNPNSGPLTVAMNWPKYSPASDLNMQLQVPVNVTRNLMKVACDFWDGAYATLNG